MKQASHFDRAERILEQVEPLTTGSVTAQLAAAQIHATLALTEQVETLGYLFAATIGFEE